jgi:hypothetical protein
MTTDLKRRDLLSRLAIGASALAVPAVLRASDAPSPALPAGTSLAPGDVRRYGMAPSASPGANAAAFQRCLAACAGSTIVNVPRADGDYTLAGRITAPAGTSIRLETGARLRWISTELTGGNWLRSASRPGIEVLGNDFKLVGEGHLIGPSHGVYVPNEIGLFSPGTTDARRRGFVVSDNVDFTDWGSHGIALAFTSDIEFRAITVHGCGYGGIQMLSCANGKILHNEVGAIGPGASGNCYGISCTHDSANYNKDPRADTDGRHVANPFSIGMLVEGNTVYDIPLWAGIDFHGAWDCTANANHVYNCRNALMMQGSSRDGVDYSGENNKVTNNSVTTRRLHGEPTTITEVTRLGISVNGGHKIRHRAVVVQNNTIDGYGDTKNTSFALQHSNTTGVDISGNRLTNWLGYGCYSANADGIIRNNEFGPIADATASACIMVAIGGPLEITGNRYVRGAGPAAKYGVYINTPGPTPNRIHDNDFRAVSTLAYAGHVGSKLSEREFSSGHP